MKKVAIFFLITVCILGISGCGTNGNLSDMSSSHEESIQNEDSINQTEKKTWSEQDIVSMFSNMKEEEWKYIDCVLIPDYASDRVGAVLFQDDKEGTSNVVFFDGDGYSQQCGTYAEIADEPDFTYLGEGTVTFKLKADDGVIYNYTLTLSINGSSVNFKVEDGFYK